MSVELTQEKFEQLLERAITREMIGKLESTLPRILESAMTRKGGAINEILTDAVNAAIARQIQVLVQDAEFVQKVEQAVAEHMEQCMTPDALVQQIFSAFNGVVFSLRPFAKKKTRPVADITEDDEG